MGATFYSNNETELDAMQVPGCPILLSIKIGKSGKRAVCVTVGIEEARKLAEKLNKAADKAYKREMAKWNK